MFYQNDDEIEHLKMISFRPFQLFSWSTEVYGIDLAFLSFWNVELVALNHIIQLKI
jgi:hypothetical protein